MECQSLEENKDALAISLDIEAWFKLARVQVSKSRYRAVIYHEGDRIDLDLYPTAEEAADAYNKKSIELFGKTDSLNKL